MIFSALLAVQCSSNAQGDNAENVSDTMDQQGNSTSNGAGTDQDGMNGSASSDMSSSSSTGSTSSTGTMTPAQERMSVTSDMQGLRAELMADLDSVRDRLNEGTMPKGVHKEDKAAAADLAQGLERVDLAIAAMDSSTDVTWASMRDVRMKEVADVRAWLTQ